MSKYDHRQHVLSDWLAELEQRFQLVEVDTDKSKITWCQLLIGTTGSAGLRPFGALRLWVQKGPYQASEVSQISWGF